jgi:hypothetical protein
MRKAVLKRSRPLKPAGLGSLEGLSSMQSALPGLPPALPEGRDRRATLMEARALGRRTRSSNPGLLRERDIERERERERERARESEREGGRARARARERWRERERERARDQFIMYIVHF